MRLPGPASPAARMLTGTIAFSGCGRGLAAPARKLSQRAGDDRQADVVERAAACRAGLSQQLARRPIADQRAVRADRRVQRRPGRAGEQVGAGGGDQTSRVTNHAADGHVRPCRGRGGRVDCVDARARRMLEFVERPADGVLPVGGQEPRPVLGGFVGLVDDQADDLKRRDSIHERVMHLAQHGHPAVLEPRHQVDLPRRARVVKRARQQRVPHACQPVVADRLVDLRQGAYVAGDVESVVAHPAGLRQAQRRPLQPPPAPLEIVEPAVDAVAQRRDASGAADHRGR